MVKHTSFLLALLPSIAMAQTPDMPTYQDLTGQPNQFDLPTQDQLSKPPRYDEMLGIAAEIAAQSGQETMRVLREKAKEQGVVVAEADEMPDDMTRKLPDGFRATILVSTSMGETALQELLLRYQRRLDVRFAFRGIPEDMTLPEFAQVIYKMSQTADGVEGVNMVLDPELFTMTGVSVAPTVLIEDFNSSPVVPDKDAGKVVMIARGLSNPDYVFQQFEDGETEMSQSSYTEVIEEDIIQRAQREAAEKMAQMTRDPERLRDRFWQRQISDLRTMPVTPARVNRTKQLFFAYVPQEDILDNDGNVLAHAGQVFQPTHVIPFDRLMVVFDPTQPNQIDFVEQQISMSRPGVTKTVLVASNLKDAAPGEYPWQQLQDLVTKFQIPVFLLTDQLRAGFQIEHTPSLVYPEMINGQPEVMLSEYVVE